MTGDFFELQSHTPAFMYREKRRIFTQFIESSFYSENVESHKYSSLSFISQSDIAIIMSGTRERQKLLTGKTWLWIMEEKSLNLNPWNPWIVKAFRIPVFGTNSIFLEYLVGKIRFNYSIEFLNWNLGRNTVFEKLPKKSSFVLK